MNSLHFTQCDWNPIILHSTKSHLPPSWCHLVYPLTLPDRYFVHWHPICPTEKYRKSSNFPTSSSSYLMQTSFYCVKRCETVHQIKLRIACMHCTLAGWQKWIENEILDTLKTMVVVSWIFIQFNFQQRFNQCDYTIHGRRKFAFLSNTFSFSGFSFYIISILFEFLCCGKKRWKKKFHYEVNVIPEKIKIWVEFLENFNLLPTCLEPWHIEKKDLLYILFSRMNNGKQWCLFQFFFQNLYIQLQLAWPRLKKKLVA